MAGKNRSNTRSKDKDSRAKKKLIIPTAYLYIFYKLCEITKKRYTSCFLQTSEVLNALKMTLKVPRKMKYIVLAEMEQCGLVKRINHQKWLIIISMRNKKYIEQIKKYLDEYPFW